MKARARVTFAVIFLVLAVVSAGKIVFRARHGIGDHMAYYRAAERVMAGADPYAATGDTYVYLYPPVWSLMVYPLTVAGPVVYGAVWALVLGASWLGARRLAQRLAGGAAGWAAVLPDLLLLRFLLGAWSSGQVTLPLAALCLGGLALAVEGRAVAGAALIAVAASIKVYPLFLGVVMWRLGGRRTALALVGFFALASCWPALVVGPPRFVELVRDGFLGSGMANLESQRWWSGRCAPLATVWHLAGGEAGRALQVAELAWAGSLAALVWTWYPRDEHGRPAWLGFAVISMLVATPMLGENYLAMLLLPVAVLVARAGRPAVRVALVGATLLLNVHSPLIVGRAHCDALERMGLSALGLVMLWAALGWTVAGSRVSARRAWRGARA